MVQHESDRWGGGRCSIMEKVFLVTRQRPAHSAPILVIE